MIFQPRRLTFTVACRRTRARLLAEARATSRAYISRTSRLCRRVLLGHSPALASLRCLIESRPPPQTGGGVASAGAMFIRDALIINARAGSSGGAVYCAAPTDMENVTIIGSYAGLVRSPAQHRVPELGACTASTARKTASSHPDFCEPPPICLQAGGAISISGAARLRRLTIINATSGGIGGGIVMFTAADLQDIFLRNVSARSVRVAWLTSIRDRVAIRANSHTCWRAPQEAAGIGVGGSARMRNVTVLGGVLTAIGGVGVRPPLSLRMTTVIKDCLSSLFCHCICASCELPALPIAGRNRGAGCTKRH